MMEELRTAVANSLVLKIIFFAIILSFILTGVGGYLIGGEKDYAIKVNDQKVSTTWFSQVLQNERYTLQDQLGEQYSRLAGQSGFTEQLRQRAVNSIVDQSLIEQYIKKVGLTADNDLVKKTILSTPSFQREGHFDHNSFLSQIRNLGMTPNGYAEAVRQYLAKQQLEQMYANTDFILPEEVDNSAKLLLQKRTVRLAELDLSNEEKQQPVTNDEINAFYQKNSQSFVSSARLKVSYIELNAADIAKKVTISAQEIKDYYEQHQTQFTQPAKKKYRVIQLSNLQDAQSIMQQIDAGSDFGKLIAEKSTDIVTKKNDGYTDWMSDNLTPKELLQTDLTQKGQYSKVLDVGNHYWIVQLADIKPAITQPLSEMSSSIADTLKQEYALKEYYSEQQKLSDAAMNDNQSLEAAENAVGVKTTTTDWFTQNNVPEQLNTPAVVNTLFGNKLVDSNGHILGNSDVINTDDNHAFVLRVAAYEPEKIKSVDQVRVQIIQDIKRIKAVTVLQDKRDTLLSALKQGHGQEELKKSGIKFGDTETLTRQSLNGPLVSATFALTPPKDKDVPSYGSYQDKNGNMVLIELESIQSGAINTDSQKSISNDLLQAKQSMNLESLLTNLRKEATIKISNFVESSQ